jgi:DNA recombination protein RmuC
MEILLTILVVLVIGSMILLTVLMKQNTTAQKDISAQNASINLLQQQLEAIRQAQTKHSETLEKNLQSGQKNITDYLQSSGKTLGELKEQLGKIEGSGRKLMELSTDVRTLSDILKSPKHRGQLGEQSLAAVLKTILPADSFKLQHTFKNGKIVDALIKLPDYSAPVDAKFPLPAFEAILKAENEDDKIKLRKKFHDDVKKRIDEIAESYILPTEGTLDFALMYIPAENVYYETIIKYDSDKTDILAYALDKKVIPVSPNLLYAYLMTIVMGLKGMQIEKEAELIRANLAKLGAGFDAFTSDYATLGSHIRNASNRYDEAQTKLNKFSMHLNQIQTTQQDPPQLDQEPKQ